MGIEFFNYSVRRLYYRIHHKIRYHPPHPPLVVKILNVFKLCGFTKEGYEKFRIESVAQIARDTNVILRTRAHHYAITHEQPTLEHAFQKVEPEKLSQSPLRVSKSLYTPSIPLLFPTLFLIKEYSRRKLEAFRNRTLLYALADSGARISEVLRLTANDIRGAHVNEQGIWSIEVRGKGQGQHGRMVTLRFTSSTLQAMKEYLKTRADSGATALFVSHAKTRPEYRGAPLSSPIQHGASSRTLPETLVCRTSTPMISATGGRRRCFERACPSTRCSATSTTAVFKPHRSTPRLPNNKLMRRE
jgi:integrase